MATIVLSSVGAAIGSGVGGSILGVPAAAIGRAIGATAGRAIDQRLLGGGSRAVPTGRIDRLRIQTAGEGAFVPRVWGQMRLSGHVIWASAVRGADDTASGKGALPSPGEGRPGLRISVALALCAGKISGVGRVWANGEEIAADDLGMRVYVGDDLQLPDPVITAYEGATAPAYCGIAYVVIEDLDLARWQNRMPQLSFEVTAPARHAAGLSAEVEAVAMIPGTGEYALASRPVSLDFGLGDRKSVNVHTNGGRTDFMTSLASLRRELPRAESVSLVVSWFGDDLRIGRCNVRPKVEDKKFDGAEMPWRAGGIARGEALEVARVKNEPVYGGTPADGSVLEALRALADGGQKAVFYPFILMEQLAGNRLDNPYGGIGQPALPWRGRITTSVAAGRAGSSDGSEAAAQEVAAFFGMARGDDFRSNGDEITYHGPQEWSYRRFILHYAHLCAQAGGVDAFLIGSEMVGMTRIRGANGTYPAVAALRRLAADVRAILGPEVKIGYAADWSEYFGHHPGNGEVFFHLDPLWADDNIDFIGIDNYMPLTDWRAGHQHLDAGWKRIDNPAYLRSGVAGGEGFDWYYATEADRAEQRRTPITDGAYDEAWVWRYKDLRGWWQNLHYDRPNGVRTRTPSPWVPGSKPIWFTELGCAALDKASNQPNRFLDARSSESGLPAFSDGTPNHALQAAFIEAVMSYWRDPQNNPAYGDSERMVDMRRVHIWCWDARPYPAFPGRGDVWSDAPAWQRGHWLNGRAAAVPLAAVVRDICDLAGVSAYDVSELTGLVKGYSLQGHESGRAALQPLMLAYGFDAVERDGGLKFVMRGSAAPIRIDPGDMVLTEQTRPLEETRTNDAAQSIRLNFVEAGGDYNVAVVKAAVPDGQREDTAETELALLMSRGEGQAIAERWLREADLSRETAQFALPASRARLAPGDVVQTGLSDNVIKCWRIDRIERADTLRCEAVRVDPAVYHGAARELEMPQQRKAQPALPVWSVFLDLPLLQADDVAHAPLLAVSARPWPGEVAVLNSAQKESGFRHAGRIFQPAMIGRTLNDLVAARPGVLDRGDALRVLLRRGNLQSISTEALLAGENFLAIGDGTPDNWEVMQFASAEPVGADVWDLRGRLRGQAGTDALMPGRWPSGALVVLLNEAAARIPVSPSLRGQERVWRIGPASRPVNDPSYQQQTFTLRGVGLRPYAPCHLRLNGRELSWIRRTRIDGDGWDGPDVPLGEAEEAYSLRLLRRHELIYETRVSQPFHLLPNDVWDGILSGGSFAAEVSQLSALFGAGPRVRRTFHVK